MADKPRENLFGLLTSDPNRVYVIAEAGVNHGGKKERALALVRAAKWAGADAVKFQTFRADRLASTQPAALAHTKEQPNLQELFKKPELPFDTFRALHKEAERLGIELLSTPFDKESADFLDELGVNAFKIASGDITHRPLIEHVAGKGKPVLLSTGMSAPEEIEKAIDWMHTRSNEQIVLLHCVSSYPAKPEELNLKSVEYLRDRFGVPVGFSDHSVGRQTAFRRNSASPLSASRRSGRSRRALRSSGSRFNEENQRSAYSGFATRPSGEGISHCRSKVWRRPRNHDGHQSVIACPLFRTQTSHCSTDHGA